ncbi:MAG TPA: fatty acid-binding protein DegV [Acholeplasmatales bacterium]|nr:fatty acid-binding protein DegV [Acholeplasmatales bacterium]
MIKIITDCTSDLLPKIYSSKDIEMIPLYITIGGKTYQDGVDISTEELYQKVQECGELPKSSAVNPATFVERFKKHIDRGNDVLFMGIGAKFSVTYQTALLAANEFPKSRVRIVDSANLSSGIGLLLLKAAKFRDAGDDLETIAQKIEALVPLVRTQFAINTLEYLHKGGRCSGTARIFGTLLKIKPIIRVIDGAMVVAQKPHGKFSVALEVMLDYLRKDKNNVDPDCIMVTHSLAPEEAVFLKDQIKKIVKADTILETFASGVISTHCGPRTIGILYILKK